MYQQSSDGSVAPLFRQPLRLLQLEVRVDRSGDTGGGRSDLIGAGVNFNQESDLSCLRRLGVSVSEAGFRAEVRHILESGGEEELGSVAVIFLGSWTSASLF